MITRELLLTEADHRELLELLEITRRGRFEDPVYLEELERELDRATVVPTDEIPEDVVRLYSRVKLEFSNIAGTTTVQILPPLRLDLFSGRISILSPLGTALIGCKVGDEVEYTVRGALRRAKILSVQHPPKVAKKRRVRRETPSRN